MMIHRKLRKRRSHRKEAKPASIFPNNLIKATWFEFHSTAFYHTLFLSLQTHIISFLSVSAILVSWRPARNLNRSGFNYGIPGAVLVMQRPLFQFILYSKFSICFSRILATDGTFLVCFVKKPFDYSFIIQLSKPIRNTSNQDKRFNFVSICT